MYRRTIWFAVWLTFFLIMLGAFVRLMDAGLGCPDWPGCYGKLTPTMAKEEINAAVNAQGGTHGPVSMPKAWKEMAHRYVATFLGFIILILMISSWMRPKERQAVLATTLFVAVCLQGAFGAWTVTMLLKPAIVTGHLIGGMTVLALLVWLGLTQSSTGRMTPAPKLRVLASIGFLLLAAQIALGGWVSTNYAALACPDLPTCQGAWLPEMEFKDAFHVMRDLGKAPDGDNLTLAALTAIHFSHRIGAILVTAVLGLLAFALIRDSEWRKYGIMLAVVLALQVGLGLANIVLSVPLSLAVAHNGGAALLVMVMTAVNVRLWQSNETELRFAPGRSLFATHRSKDFASGVQLQLQNKT